MSTRRIRKQRRAIRAILTGEVAKAALAAYGLPWVTIRPDDMVEAPDAS